MANGSLPLLNVPYNADMLRDTSDHFKSVEEPLCKEVYIL